MQSMLNYHACVQKSPTIGLPVTKLYTNHMVLVRRSAVARLKGVIVGWIRISMPSYPKNHNGTVAVG